MNRNLSSDELGCPKSAAQHQKGSDGISGHSKNSCNNNNEWKCRMSDWRDLRQWERCKIPLANSCESQIELNLFITQNILISIQLLYCTFHATFTVLRLSEVKISLYHATPHFLPGWKWSYMCIVLSIKEVHCTNTADLISVNIKLNRWSTLCLCMQSSISYPYKDCEQRLLLTRESTPALFIANGH